MDGRRRCRSQVNSSTPYVFLNKTALVNSTANASAACVTAFAKDVPWDMSFFVLGAIIAVGGLLVFLFLVPHPTMVWMQSPDVVDQKTSGNVVSVSHHRVERNARCALFTHEGCAPAAMLPTGCSKSCCCCCCCCRRPCRGATTVRLHVSPVPGCLLAPVPVPVVSRT